MILADNGLFFVVLSSKMSKNATNCQYIQIYSNVCMMYDDQVKNLILIKENQNHLFLQSIFVNIKI